MGSYQSDGGAAGDGMQRPMVGSLAANGPVHAATNPAQPEAALAGPTAGPCLPACGDPAAGAASRSPPAPVPGARPARRPGASPRPARQGAKGPYRPAPDHPWQCFPSSWRSVQ
jgi:hypothetical protein